MTERKKKLTNKADTYPDCINSSSSYRREGFVCGSLDYVIKDCTDQRKQRKDECVKKKLKPLHRKAMRYFERVSAETAKDNKAYAHTFMDRYIDPAKNNA